MAWGELSFQMRFPANRAQGASPFSAPLPSSQSAFLHSLASERKKQRGDCFFRSAPSPSNYLAIAIYAHLYCSFERREAGGSFVYSLRPGLGSCTQALCGSASKFTSFSFETQGCHYAVMRGAEAGCRRDATASSFSLFYLCNDDDDDYGGW